MYAYWCSNFKSYFDTFKVVQEQRKNTPKWSNTLPKLRPLHIKHEQAKQNKNKCHEVQSLSVYVLIHT